MKAKIKKTGEIVEIICYSCSTIRRPQDSISYIDSKGVAHDRESLNYYWDFEPIETDTDEHWQDVRERAAIAALQGLSANPNLVNVNGYEKIDITIRAMRYANALIEELKKK